MCQLLDLELAKTLKLPDHEGNEFKGMNFYPL